MIAVLTAIGSGALLSLPLIAGSRHAASPVRVVMVRLGSAAHASQVAAALQPYASAPPEHFVIVEADQSRWPCTSTKTAASKLIVGPKAPKPPKPPAPPVALPSYCSPLSAIISRMTSSPVVLTSVPASGKHASRDGQASPQHWLTDLYGKDMDVTGGPNVFAGLLPTSEAFSTVKAAAIVLVLALAIAFACTWYLGRRDIRFAGQARRKPEADPLAGTGGNSNFDARKPDTGSGGRPSPRPGDREPVTDPPYRPPPRLPSQPPRIAPDPPPVPLFQENQAPVSVPGVPPRLGEASKTARSAWGLPLDPSPSAISADSVQLGGLEIRAASVVGPGHRVKRPAVARQDAYRLGQDPAGRYLLIAVADGMSDSKNSDLGANVAATAVISQLRAALAVQPDPSLINAADMYRAVAGQMIATAEQRGFAPDTVRTAILAAVVPTQPDRQGHRTVWLAGIADVSAWLMRSGTWQQIAGQPKGGMDANVVSEFLPYHPHEASTALETFDHRDVLAVTTDGIADAFSVINGAADWFADRWREPPPIASFILDVGYEAKTHNDDRTAVVVWFEGTRTGRELP